MKTFYQITVLAILFISVGCAQLDESKNITAAELKSILSNQDSIVVLDVRTPEELESSLGKIDGAINIPLQELETRIDELKPFASKEIAVICRSGNRSVSATQMLLEHGYNAKNVLGGMKAFRSE